MDRYWKIVKHDYTLIYPDGEDHKNGVGITLRNEVAQSLIGYWPIPDRVVMVKLQAKPFNINMIQVCAPTQDYDDENIEESYEQIQSAVSFTKSSDIICIMGDLNVTVCAWGHHFSLCKEGVMRTSTSAFPLRGTSSTQSTMYMHRLSCQNRPWHHQSVIW